MSICRVACCGAPPLIPGRWRFRQVLVLQFPITMGVRNRQFRRKKPRTPAAGAAILPRSKKRSQAQESEEHGDLPNRRALITRLESQRLELLRAMACVHLARRTIEAHIAEPRQGDVLPFRTEQHESYRQRVAEALSAAGEALATAYPMLERIARALDADEMLKEYATEHPQPPARRSAASRPS